MIRTRILRPGMPVVSVLLTLALFLPAHFAAGQSGLLTVAESTGFRQTSLHSDVLDFVSELQALSPLIRVETMAVSAEGRPLPVIVIGDPVPASPLDLRFDDRAVVYIQANIHAGEVEGKEAALCGRTCLWACVVAPGAAPGFCLSIV